MGFAPFVLVGISVVFTVFLAPPAHAAWTEPSASPPGGNVAAPLNISSTPQTKQGELNVEGIFRAQGGLEATGGTGNYRIRAVAPTAPIGVTTSGVLGEGQSATGTGYSTGVYGISYALGPGTGMHVGLLGVAGASSSNSVGIYGWDGAHTSAYAGYFRGRVAIEGEFCLNGDCRVGWPEGGPGGGSLFTESPQNNTYLTNTGSNLAIGGTDSGNADFFFDVTATPGTFYAAESIIIGSPVGGAVAGDGICATNETCASSDCRGQPDSCAEGQLCDPAGSGVCVNADTIPPTPPGNLRANGPVGAGMVPLVWDASTDTGGSGLAGYKIYRCTGAGCSPITLLIDTQNTAVTYTDLSVSASTTYNYLVKAYDGAQNPSDASNILQVTTPAQGDFIPPSIPQNLRVNGVIQSVLVPIAWDASTDTGGSGLAGYKIYRCQGAGCTPTLHDTLIGLGTTYDDVIDLVPDSVYVYRVSAFDGDGNESQPSPSLQITTPADTTPPTIPQSLRLDGTVTDTTIPLAWDASTDTGGSGLSGYKIYICSGAGCVPSTLLHTNGLVTTYTASGLTAGTTYNFEVTAIDSAVPPNESGRSNRLQAATTGGGGQSPAILKETPPPLDVPPGGMNTLPNPTISRSTLTEPVEGPLVSGVLPLSRPLSSFFGIPTAEAKLGFFSIPEAQAAGPFGGNPKIRLTVNDGVLQIKDAGGTIMELGNAGTDIAATGNINIRPGTTTQAQGAVFARNGTETDLTLTGKMVSPEYCIGAACITAWPSGGGAVANSDQVIWNTLAGTPLGGFPQTGGFHLTQQGIVNSFVVGPTYLNPPADYTVIGASLFVGGSNGNVGIGTIAPTNKLQIGISGHTNYALTTRAALYGAVVETTGADDANAAFWVRSNVDTTAKELLYVQNNGTVGINTVAPNASYKLDVSGDANATRLCIAGDCRAIWPSGGGGGLDGNGTANAIPMWFDVDTLTSSAIFQEGTNISIGDQTAAYPLDVVGQANAAELGLDGDFISGWDELILNQLTPAQPANFNITGSGTIETKLTVGETLELPTYNRTSYASRIDRNNTALEGYYISSKYVFGAEPGNPWGMGFFTDDLPDSPIVVINRDREVHLGYVGAATDLCLYGSGVRECRDSWPSGGGAVANSDQVIWNTLAGTPLGGFPQTGGFHLTQQGIVNSFIAGPTYANPPTDYTVIGASLFVGGSNSAVGINTIAPNSNYKLDVGGNINTSGLYYKGGIAGLNNAYCAGANTIVTDITVSGGIVTAVACEGDDGGGGGISGSGTAGQIPKFLDTQLLGNSVIYEDNSRIAIGGAPDAGAEMFQLRRSSEWAGFEYDSGTNLLSIAVHAGSEIQTLSIDYDDPVFNFGTASVGNALSIEKLGDVGIGDSTPDAKLDVAGNALFTPSALDPDTYNTRTIIAQISDNGWIANGMAFGSASGSAAAIGALAGNFYLGMQNGANTMTTFLQHIAASRSTLFPASGGVQIGVNGQDGKLTLFSEGTTDYTVIFQPHGTQTQNITYTLPANDGDNGQFLSTNGSGALSWAAGGGAISNSDQVIWNTGAGTYLGSMCNYAGFQRPCPQAFGGFHTDRQGIVSSLIVGPTYLDPQPPPQGDYSITNATLSVSGPSGRVGIGTISPSAWGILTLAGNQVFANEDTDYVISTSANGGAIRLRGDVGGTNRYLDLGWTDNNQVFTPRLTINDSQNVGIGDSSPLALLTVGNNELFQVTSTGNVQTGNNGQDGKLTIFSEQGGTDYSVIFQPHGTQTQNITYTLPANDGDNGQFLSTNGSGALSWAAGGGAISNSDQVIWNTGAGTYLGSMCNYAGFQRPCPQAFGGFHTDRQGIVSSLIVGPTYLDPQPPPQGDYSITNATLSVSGPVGSVGINTTSPNTSYKLDVNGAIRSQADNDLSIGNIAAQNRLYTSSSNWLVYLNSANGYGRAQFGQTRLGSYFQNDWDGASNNVGWYWNAYYDNVTDNRWECIESTAWGGTSSKLAGTGNQLFYQQAAACAADNNPVTWLSRFAIIANGNVGIATDSPKGLLHVAGDAVLGADANNNKFIWHTRSGNNGDFMQITYDDASGNWVWAQGIRLKRSNGSVGIGVNGDPLAKLTVNNNVTSSGNALDTIGAYGNNSGGSTIYAQQSHVSAFAGYFSGNSNDPVNGGGALFDIGVLRAHNDTLPTANANMGAAIYASTGTPNYTELWNDDKFTAGLFAHSGDSTNADTIGVRAIGGIVSNASALVYSIGVEGRGNSVSGTGGSETYGVRALGGRADGTSTKSYGIYAGASTGGTSNNEWAGYFLGKTEVVGDFVATTNTRQDEEYREFDTVGGDVQMCPLQKFVCGVRYWNSGNEANRRLTGIYCCEL